MSQPAVDGLESRSPRAPTGRRATGVVGVGRWATRLADSHEPPEAFRALASRPDPIYHAVLLLLCICVLLAAFVLTIRDGSQVVLPVLQIPLPQLCTARLLTGISCPGCGLTRSFISLAHGDIASAWSYNPAGLWLFAIMALQIPFRSYQLWRIRRGQAEIELRSAAQPALLILAIALLSQWTLRLAGVTF